MDVIMFWVFEHIPKLLEVEETTFDSKTLKLSVLHTNLWFQL